MAFRVCNDMCVLYDPIPDWVEHKYCMIDKFIGFFHWSLMSSLSYCVDSSEGLIYIFISFVVQASRANNM